MASNRETASILEDVKINVKIKLSALWVAVVLCAAYTDILTYMRSDVLQGFIAGEAGGVPVTQVSTLVWAILKLIQITMVFLSLALKAEVNRWANIIVGISHAGVILITILPIWGAFWAYHYVLAIAEVVFSALIVWHAWNWPKPERVEVTP